MAKDRSRDEEWVEVIGGPHLRPRKMKRRLAENPDVRAMGIHIVGEGQLRDLEPARRGRKSNAEKENEVLRAKLAEMEAKLNAIPAADAAQA